MTASHILAVDVDRLYLWSRRPPSDGLHTAQKPLVELQFRMIGLCPIAGPVVLHPHGSPAHISATIWMLSGPLKLHGVCLVGKLDAATPSMMQQSANSRSFGAHQGVGRRRSFAVGR
jgi:hypothetical protein